MDELRAALEVQAQIIAALKTEKASMAQTIEVLKAQIAAQTEQRGN